MNLALVAAVAHDGMIGAGGTLAWKISDDLKWFKKVTMNKPIIMGRKTFQSIGRALPGRDNIVITRARDFHADGVFIANTIDAALALGRECADQRDTDETCVIGGGEIYAQTLDQAGRIYLTKVDAKVTGDTYFPAIDSDVWRETHHGTCEKTERNQFACEFVILDRRAL